MFRNSTATVIQELSRNLTILSWVVIAGFGEMLGCHQAPIPSEIPVRAPRLLYQVTVEPGLRRASVEVCAEGFAPSRIAPMSGGPGSETARPTKPGCFTYTARLHRAEPWMPKMGDAVLSSHEEWLWCPDPLPTGLTGRVRFRLPPGVTVGTPWPKVDDEYVLDSTAFRRGNSHVFGAVTTTRVVVANTDVEIVSAEGAPSITSLGAWIEDAVYAVAAVGARFPVPRMLVIAIPVQSPEPVAFGLLRRGGGISVMLLPSDKADAADFERDWVAVHEFSHLWLPILRDDAAWIGEGIATYFQELLRARCGQQTPEEAWERVLAGFERGRTAGTGRTLVNESQAMHETGAYRRVYWAGMVFALETDMHLRGQTDGAMTLERALVAALPLWNTAAEPPTTEAALSVLATASGVPSLVPLGRRHARLTKFPVWTDLRFAELERSFLEFAQPAADHCRPSTSAESSQSRAADQ